ncbi:hypothetical protein D0817_14815 [Flavobacterium cupreum]|uniref:Uncharacterized protein n=1 Tax=Flavobacterium cupreum TaxID=2133766 RepID=A0A434A6G1_9FLAO|nr:hypothetical protein D0817_14815 [Flavobacterium cupreum]
MPGRTQPKPFYFHKPSTTLRVTISKTKQNKKTNLLLKCTYITYMVLTDARLNPAEALLFPQAFDYAQGDNLKN